MWSVVGGVGRVGMVHIALQLQLLLSSLASLPSSFEKLSWKKIYHGQKFAPTTKMY
jgi:hypothetical protein